MSNHHPSSSTPGDDPSVPAETVQMTNEEEEELMASSEKDTSDSGKLKTLMGVLKKMVGVKDMAAIRLSLPANLLEPIPNLEYWNYLDRGDLFTCIGELNNPLDRFLQVLRFTFTKELKFIHGKICKPYNSILGEHFRCHWDINQPILIDSSNNQIVPRAGLRTKKSTPLPLASSTSTSVGASSASTSSRPSSIKSATTNSRNLEVPSQQQQQQSSSSSLPSSVDDSAGKKARAGLSRFISRDKVPKTQPPTQSSGGSANASASASLKSPVLSAADTSLSGAVDGLSLSDSNGGSSRRVCFLTEQVSHHPPISSFFVECKDTGVQLCGVDQLSAKFTGTSIKVFPGEHNKGIFVKLTADSPLGEQVDGEEYQITHPTASINGLLRGSLWVAICDTLYITCRGGSTTNSEGKKTRLRSVIEYKDESWLTKAKYALEGVIYEYDVDDEDPDAYKTVKDVPSDKVVATIEGSWKGKIYWRKKGDKDSKLLINLEELNPLPKTVRPLKSQESYESRRIWESVTSSILEKNFSQATKNKQKIEQQQRNLALERKNRNEEFTPQYFHEDISDGRPRLSAKGREAVDGERELKGYNEMDNTAEDSSQKRDAKVVDDHDEEDEDDNSSFRSAED